MQNQTCQCDNRPADTINWLVHRRSAAIFQRARVNASSADGTNSDANARATSCGWGVYGVFGRPTRMRTNMQTSFYLSLAAYGDSVMMYSVISGNFPGTI